MRARSAFCNFSSLVSLTSFFSGLRSQSALGVMVEAFGSVMKSPQFVVAASLTFGVLPCIPAHAQQAPTVTNPSSILENSSANDGNFATGVVMDERATVSPNPTTSPIYGFMKQGTTKTALLTRPDSINPDWVQASIPYDSSLTGQWTFKISSTTNFSPSTTTTVKTPAIGTSVGAMPFVDSMTITTDSTGLSPTISWILPTSGYPNDPTGNQMPGIDKAAVSVSDITSPITRTNIDPNSKHFGNTFQQSNVIYGSGQFDPSQTTFTIPTTNGNSNTANSGSPVLQYGHTYSIGIHLEHLSGAAVSGCDLCNVNSRSTSFFDYTPIDTGNTPGLPTNAVINMPTVHPVSTTSGQVSPLVYNFNVGSVGKSSVTYIDPVVATGFIYTVGATDPYFASVDPITDVGSGSYLLSVWNATTLSYDLVDSTLAADSTFNFLTNGYTKGVSKFEITGINPNVGLDPTDISAFITGLTFVGGGHFTGTMEAIQASATPLPASWILMATGILGLGFLARRRSRAFPQFAT